MKQNKTDKLKQHEKSKKHLTAMESMPSQSSVVSVNGSLQLLKSPLQQSLSIENHFMLWLLIIHFLQDTFKLLIPRLQRDTHSMLIKIGMLVYMELLLM